MDLTQNQIDMLLTKTQTVITEIVDLRDVYKQDSKLTYFYVSIPPYILSQMAYTLASKKLQSFGIRTILLENRLLVMV